MLIGTCVVIASAAVMSWALGISHVQSEITGRISPNLIDLGIAVAASIAGSFTMTRERLSNSIAGVAIAVALVPPLCVYGIGLTLGKDVIAVFGRGSVAGLSNQIAEGSFLLFVANLIGITLAGLMVFLLQQYGSIAKCWKNLLIWFAFLGLLSIPCLQADFSLKQQLNSEFQRFKAGQVKRFKLVNENPYALSRSTPAAAMCRLMTTKRLRFCDQCSGRSDGAIGVGEIYRQLLTRTGPGLMTSISTSALFQQGVPTTLTTGRLPSVDHRISCPPPARAALPWPHRRLLPRFRRVRTDDAQEQAACCSSS